MPPEPPSPNASAYATVGARSPARRLQFERQEFSTVKCKHVGRQPMLHLSQAVPCAPAV